MINLEKKIIFIANPKSGSDTIRKYLSKTPAPGFVSEHSFIDIDKYVRLCEEQIKDKDILKWTSRKDQVEHISCALYKEYLDRYTEYEFVDFFVFSTIRNPWSRYVSAFEYGRWHPEFQLQGDFSKYVEAPHFLHVRPFDFMFKDHGGRLLCHKFIDMKDIDLEVPKLLKANGIHATFPMEHTNVSPKGKDYREYYDEKAKRIIAKRCEEVIVNFGYTFE